MNENENVELEQQIPSNFDESISFEGLDAKYVELQKQLEELTDKYYRANADFENIKKRFEKEKADIATYANEKFARDLLPVIDALEMAVNLETEGIYITIGQFKKCFEKNGITPIETEGEFDPNFHNAVLQIDSEDVEKGKIVQVIQKGYLINGRVLRPAMVSIAK